MYKNLRAKVTTAISGNGLRAKVLRGGAWLATGNVAEQTARFARNLILVRLLAPAAFGTMALVLSASSLLQAFTEIGVRDALIQNPKGEEPEYISAAWWMAFARAWVIYALLFLIAPFVATFYRNPELGPLLRVAVLSLLFEGAMSTRAYISLKEMKFGRWAWIYHGGGVCGTVITVVLSFFIRDVWALAFGSCAESLARCVLSYVICPYIPRLRFDTNAFKDLVRFSRGVLGLSLLNLVFLRADTFVLAKLFSAAQVGLYIMAVYLAQVPTSFIMKLMGNIFLPTFARMQGDKARTNRVVILIASVIMTLGMPALTFVLFSGKVLITFLYGQRYATASASLILATGVALINLVNSEATGVFYAWGRPQLHRLCVAIMAGTMIVLTYPLAKWLGPVGGQVACIISISLGFLFQLRRLSVLTGFHMRQYGWMFLISLAISTPAVVCLMAVHFQHLAGALSPITIGLVGCVLSYGIAGAFFLRGRSLVHGLLAVDANFPADNSEAGHTSTSQIPPFQNKVAEYVS